MKLYQIIIKPEGGFSTPLKADTLFGHFCWQAALAPEILKGGLEKWVKYYEDHPFVVFSSAWPCFYHENNKQYIYAVKRPDLPFSFLLEEHGSSPREILKERKEKQKKKWMLIGEEMKVDLKKCEFITDHELAERIKTSSSSKKDGSGPEVILQTTERLHNRINRLTGTTGERFSPFGVRQIFYDPEIELTIFILLDEEATDIEKVSLALERIGTYGFGADASTGSGRFQLGEWEELPIPSSEKANACYCLGPVIPEKDNYEKMYFRPFIRFGRHGNWLAISANPFKNPVVMADEGAVLVSEKKEVFQKPYVGRGVTGLSKILPSTIHQGYALYIPFYLESSHE